jgi:hypothetical protein
MTKKKRGVIINKGKRLRGKSNSRRKDNREINPTWIRRRKADWIKVTDDEVY